MRDPPSGPSLPDLLADLSAKLAFHAREEKLCAEQEALFRDRRAQHAAEVERITQTYEALRTSVAAAQEIAARRIPAEVPVEDLGTRNRPKLTRMITKILDDLPKSARIGAREVTEEVNRRFGAHLRKPADPERVSIALRRLAESGRLHRLRKGRPYHEALYTREKPAG